MSNGRVITRPIVCILIVMCKDMNEILLSTVKISQKGISEVDGNKDSVFVPRERINSVNLL